MDDFERHFAELNAHLARVWPILNTFCARRGFASRSGPGLSRYPRIRLSKPDERLQESQKSGVLKISFELQMCLDPAGKRYEQFLEESPYELGAGASVNIQDESGERTRYGKFFMIFENVPFCDVPQRLNFDLEQNLPVLQSWDVPLLMRQGRRSPLGRLE